MKANRKNLHVLTPESLSELLLILDANPDYKIYSGGVSFMSRQKREPLPAQMVDIINIKELHKLNRTDRYIDIGAGISLSHLVSLGPNVIPEILYKALNATGNPGLRNMITLGGNICLGQTYSSLIPVLIILGTRLEIRDHTQVKWVGIHSLYKKPEETTLEPRQVLTRIRIPFINYNVSQFKQVREANPGQTAKIVFAALAQINKNVIGDLRFCISCMNPHFYRNRVVENSFCEMHVPLPVRDTAKILSLLEEEIKPIQDSQSTTLYRRQTALRFVHNFLKSLRPQ